MNTEELLDHCKTRLQNMMKIMEDKNADYTGDDEDPFKNFLMVERLGITSCETGFLTRISDKFSRLCSLLKPGKVARVSDETLSDTLLDMANYCLLLEAYLTHKREDEEFEE